MFSKHGHLIASYHPKDVILDYEEELLSGLFSAMQISYQASYDNPLRSMPGKKNRLYFFSDNENSIIYAVNCAFISHMDVQAFFKKIRNTIDQRFNIDGNKPCHIPVPVYNEIQEILSNETQELENYVRAKYYIPE
jgi:hypothetical protein